jgi:hypothetical protein
MSICDSSNYAQYMALYNSFNKNYISINLSNYKNLVPNINKHVYAHCNLCSLVLLK